MLFGRSNNALSHQYVLSVLTRDKKENVSTLPAYLPDGGSIYLYDTRINKRDWMADGYSWTNNGRRKMPNINLQKGLFHVNRGITRSTKFRRHSYATMDDETDYMLIHYIGDKTAYIPSKHGNSKNSDAIYQRVLPSALTKAKNKMINSTCKRGMKKLNTDSLNEIEDPDVRRLSTIDMARLKNIRYTCRRNTDYKVSQDEIWKIFKLTEDENKFVRHIDVYPHFFCIAGTNEILTMINDVLTQVLDVPLLFYFNTTASGMYYYSTLLICKHPAFPQLVPVACVVHNATFHSIFDSVLFHICQLIPNLKVCVCVFVLKRDGQMNDNFRSLCQAAHIVYCWDQLRNAFKMSNKQDPYNHYKRDFNMLMRSNNQWEFLSNLERVRTHWSKAKSQQFEEKYKDAILQFAARWVLADLRVLDQREGMSTKPHDVWRTIVEQLADKQECAPTVVLSAFSEFQSSIWQDINANVGMPDSLLQNEQIEYEVEQENSSDIDFSD